MPQFPQNIEKISADAAAEHVHNVDVPSLRKKIAEEQKKTAEVLGKINSLKLDALQTLCEGREEFPVAHRATMLALMQPLPDPYLSPDTPANDPRRARYEELMKTYEDLAGIQENIDVLASVFPGLLTKPGGASEQQQREFGNRMRLLRQSLSAVRLEAVQQYLKNVDAFHGERAIEDNVVFGRMYNALFPLRAGTDGRQERAVRPDQLHALFAELYGVQPLPPSRANHPRFGQPLPEEETARKQEAEARLGIIFRWYRVFGRPADLARIDFASTGADEDAVKKMREQIQRQPADAIPPYNIHALRGSVDAVARRLKLNVDLPTQEVASIREAMSTFFLEREQYVIATGSRSVQLPESSLGERWATFLALAAVQHPLQEGARKLVNVQARFAPLEQNPAMERSLRVFKDDMTLKLMNSHYSPAQIEHILGGLEELHHTFNAPMRQLFYDCINMNMLDGAFFALLVHASPNKSKAIVEWYMMMGLNSGVAGATRMAEVLLLNIMRRAPQLSARLLPIMRALGKNPIGLTVVLATIMVGLGENIAHGAQWADDRMWDWVRSTLHYVGSALSVPFDVVGRAGQDLGLSTVDPQRDQVRFLGSERFTFSGQDYFRTTKQWDDMVETATTTGNMPNAILRDLGRMEKIGANPQDLERWKKRRAFEVFRKTSALLRKEEELFSKLREKGITSRLGLRRSDLCATMHATDEALSLRGAPRNDHRLEEALRSGGDFWGIKQEMEKLKQYKYDAETNEQSRKFNEEHKDEVGLRMLWESYVFDAMELAQHVSLYRSMGIYNKSEWLGSGDAWMSMHDERRGYQIPALVQEGMTLELVRRLDRKSAITFKKNGSGTPRNYATTLADAVVLPNTSLLDRFTWNFMQLRRVNQRDQRRDQLHKALTERAVAFATQYSSAGTDETQCAAFNDALQPLQDLVLLHNEDGPPTNERLETVLREMGGTSPVAPQASNLTAARDLAGSAAAPLIIMKGAGIVTRNATLQRPFDATVRAGGNALRYVAGSGRAAAAATEGATGAATLAQGSRSLRALRVAGPVAVLAEGYLAVDAHQEAERREKHVAALQADIENLLPQMLPEQDYERRGNNYRHRTLGYEIRGDDILHMAKERAEQAAFDRNVAFVTAGAVTAGMAAAFFLASNPIGWGVAVVGAGKWMWDKWNESERNLELSRFIGRIDPRLLQFFTLSQITGLSPEELDERIGTVRGLREGAATLTNKVDAKRKLVAGALLTSVYRNPPVELSLLIPPNGHTVAEELTHIVGVGDGDKVSFRVPRTGNEGSRWSEELGTCKEILASPDAHADRAVRLLLLHSYRAWRERLSALEHGEAPVRGESKESVRARVTEIGQQYLSSGYTVFDFLRTKEENTASATTNQAGSFDLPLADNTARAPIRYEVGRRHPRSAALHEEMGRKILESRQGVEKTQYRNLDCYRFPLGDNRYAYYACISGQWMWCGASPDALWHPVGTDFYPNPDEAREEANTLSRLLKDIATRIPADIDPIPGNRGRVLESLGASALLQVPGCRMRVGNGVRYYELDGEYYGGRNYTRTFVCLAGRWLYKDSAGNARGEWKPVHNGIPSYVQDSADARVKFLTNERRVADDSGASPASRSSSALFMLQHEADDASIRSEQRYAENIEKRGMTALETQTELVPVHETNGLHLGYPSYHAYFQDGSETKQAYFTFIGDRWFWSVTGSNTWKPVTEGRYQNVAETDDRAKLNRVLQLLS